MASLVRPLLVSYFVSSVHIRLPCWYRKSQENRFTRETCGKFERGGGLGGMRGSLSLYWLCIILGTASN